MTTMFIKKNATDVTRFLITKVGMIVYNRSNNIIFLINFTSAQVIHSKVKI